jgi:folylpolyglutamate synthase/dihydropteroate synthase
MFEALLPRMEKVIVTQSTHPRAAIAESLAALAAEMGMIARPLPTMEAALAEARSHASDETVILVTGSIFVAASAQAILGKPPA